MTDRSEIVIVNERLYHLGIKKGDLAQNVFIVGDPARAIRVSKEFDTIMCQCMWPYRYPIPIS